MNRAEFHNILQHPQDISSADVDGIRAIVDAFPYFQPARALYLKALKDDESYKYNQELKTTAAYTTDRSILFDFITSEDFQQNEISKSIKQNTIYLKEMDVDADDISVDKKVSDDPELKKHIEDTKDVLDPDLFQPKIKKAPIAYFELDKTEEITESKSDTSLNDTEENISENEEETTSIDILNIGKPLEFDAKETHSFNEWLKLTSYQPIERNEESDKKDSSEKREQPKEVSTKTDETETDRKRKFALIDKFISINPKISPEKSTGKNKNLAEESILQPDALMTETLARIYLEQKNYKKAIQSYKILSLKYPEKSGFFADQIKAVEKLQEQNK
ncbi:hypothetical protein GZ212_12925 [Mangrovimonas sp. CR14]|uniref:hypothetical protein n=1 Tax=Mangrovimonas sp. CR14 TaxID=2706120 RepID=UPI0014202D0C|nr:hypothetical protein [Mangrovimonas sp. CR14]NIK93060.1 hypothetical protein [Mangrovimonas sp. CR14]